MFFNVQCDCENQTKAAMRLSALKCGHSKSCGCIKFNNPNTVQDLAGQEFGRLTALYRDIERDLELRKMGKKGVHWICQCNCGNPKLISISAYSLTSGQTKSCGCYASERIKIRNKKYSTKINKFVDNNDGSYTLYDQENHTCIIDAEDYDIVKNWYWRKLAKRGDINKGYWMTNTKDDDQYNTSVIFLLQVIGEIKYGAYDRNIVFTDHLSRNTDDYRKCNLKLKTNEENSHNRSLSKANTSGKTGVSFNKQKRLWTAYITVNYRTIHLGDFIDINEAIDVRKAAEKKYGFTCDDVIAEYDKTS